MLGNSPLLLTFSTIEKSKSHSWLIGQRHRQVAGWVWPRGPEFANHSAQDQLLFLLLRASPGFPILDVTQARVPASVGSFVVHVR